MCCIELPAFTVSTIAALQQNAMRKKIDISPRAGVRVDHGAMLLIVAIRAASRSIYSTRCTHKSYNVLMFICSELVVIAIVSCNSLASSSSLCGALILCTATAPAFYIDFIERVRFASARQTAPSFARPRSCVIFSAAHRA